MNKNENVTGKELGKILYFDPNNVTIKGDVGDNLSAIFNGVGLFKDPEDYCISVDLEVTNKSRNNITTNDQKMTYSMSKSNGMSSFFQGKTIGEQNTLTTFFDNITYDKDSSETNSEAMCISSIDIEFTSWYVASVVIKFTDVRGASLFSEKDDTNDEKLLNDSLFSGFFTMPYPIFKLKVKGFYGNSVTYPLHCQDFKAEFNTEKGCFDLTVQFIGYTFAMLSDIQMTYILAAPYSEMYGQSYWDEQVKNGRFLTLEGNVLPKIPDLLKKIEKGKYTLSTIESSNENFKIAESLDNKLSSINNIKKLIDEYIESLESNYNLTRASDIYNITNISTTGNTLSETLANDVKSGPFIQKLFEEINKYINTYPDDKLFLNYKGENAKKYFYIKNIKKNNNVTTGNLNLSEIVNLIDIRQKNNNNEKKNIDEQVESTKQNTLIETYQMVPSIYNFTKLLLAHMETLLHCIASCANEVNKNIDNRGYVPSGQDIDLNHNKFYPFPWFTVNDNGKDRDEWIGLYHPDFTEVKLVKSLIKAKTEISRELETIQTIPPTGNIAENNTNISIGDIWFPINAYDNSINLIGGKTFKPYSNLIKENGVNIQELKSILSTRIATIVGLSAKYGDLNSYKAYSLGESKNIIAELGNNDEHINKTISALNDIKKLSDENNKKLTTTLKYYVDANNTKKSYEYNFLNTNVLPFSDNTISTLKKEVTNGVIKSNLKYYVGNYGVNEKNTNSVYFEILDGFENSELINNVWLSGVKTLIGDVVNLNEIIKNYKLDKSYSSSYFIDANYELQPLMNRISYVRPEIEVDKNDSILLPFYNYCGVSPYNIGAGSNDFSMSPNMYKLFLGKDNLEDSKNLQISLLKNKDLFVNGNSDYNFYSYPLIGGNFIYEMKNGIIDETVTCLFGNPLYYRQNDTIDKEIRSKCKAYLFLQTISIDVNNIITLLNDNPRSFMIRTPKTVLLLLGSMLWRKHFNGEPILSIDGITIPDKNKYMKDKYGNFMITNQNNNEYADCIGLDSLNNNFIIRNKLIKYFDDWVNLDNSDTGWKTIENEFELKPNVNKIFTGEKFKEFIKKCKNSDNLNKTLEKEIKGVKILNKYGVYIPKKHDYFINLINNDKTDGIKSLLKLLFSESTISFTGDGKLFTKKINGKSIDDTVLKEDYVNYVINTIIAKLSEHKKNINTVTSSTINNTESKVNTLNISEEQNANLQTYKYLKILYDKWVSGYEYNTDKSEYKWIGINKIKVNGYNTNDLINFKFIDRSYSNIGNKFIIDFEDVMKNMIGMNEQKTLYSTLTDIFSKNNFLFVPMPNYQSWNSATDFAKIFQPMSYSESNMTSETEDFTSMFICIYTGEPSKSLNINSTSNEFKNDSLNLKIEDFTYVPEDFTTVDTNSDNGVINKVPVFVVSYGKQNQSYFKNIVLNQNNPVTTEASILAVKNLNDRNDKTSSVTTISQNMYNVYSNYSYTCQVEMMGCPQIQPMMYFQLTNSPMWNGAYMIYKVNHSIRPGYMSTNFTGMRMSKNYPILVKPSVVSSGDFGLGSNVTPKNNKISTLSFDTKIGKYYTLKNYTTLDYNTGNKHIKEIPEYIISRLQNNVAPTLDSICDTWAVSDLNKGYGKLKITSGYRIKDKDKKSQHYQGLAVDIQLIKNSKIGNDALFEHIKTRMRGGLKMDQLIKEYSDGGGWCHVSPVYTDNSIVRVNGEVLEYNKTNTEVVAREEIEEAKSSGKICNYQSPNIKWFNYWKNAENGIKKGWNSSENKWYAHSSAEGGDPTIAYGIKLSSGFLQSNEMKFMNLNDLQNGSIGISESVAENEIITKANNALIDIKKLINDRFGVSYFDNIEEKYKYAMVDIYLNHGGGNFKKDTWKSFIEGAVNNDLNKMLANSNRGNTQRTKLFIDYLKS